MADSAVSVAETALGVFIVAQFIFWFAIAIALGPRIERAGVGIRAMDFWFAWSWQTLSVVGFLYGSAVTKMAGPVMRPVIWLWRFTYPAAMLTTVGLGLYLFSTGQL